MAWQQVTVRNDRVSVTEAGPQRAVVRTTGTSTDFPDLTVTNPQPYGLIYDASTSGLQAIATGNWVMSTLPVEIAPGAELTLTRRIVAVHNGGTADPFAVLSQLYRAAG